MRLTFKSVDFEESRLTSIMWVGLNQSALIEQKTDLSRVRRNSANRLLLDLNCNSFLGLQTAGLPCRTQTYQASVIG